MSAWTSDVQASIDSHLIRDAKSMALEIYNPEQEVERQKEQTESLRQEVFELVLMTGLEVSNDEIRVSIEGSQNEEEAKIPFNIAERAGRFGYKASVSIGSDRRVFGAQELVLKGISYIYGSPETAKKCFDLARQIWDGNIEWSKEIDIPEPQMEVERPPIAESGKEKKAA